MVGVRKGICIDPVTGMRSIEEANTAVWGSVIGPT